MARRRGSLADHLLLVLVLLAASSLSCTASRELSLDGTPLRLFVRAGEDGGLVLALDNYEQAVRLMVEAEGDEGEFGTQHPLLVVVRQPRAVTSWSIPYVESGHAYSFVERTLCPLQNKPHITDNSSSTNTSITIDLSTSSPLPVNVTVSATTVDMFNLKMDSPVTFTTSPSAPAFFVFEYPDDVGRVRVKLTSSGESGPICAIASLQESFCPEMELLDNPDHRGMFQTLESIAAINAQKKSPAYSDVSEFDFFYVVLTVFPDNQQCMRNTTQKSIVDSLVTLETTDNYSPVSSDGRLRSKNITILVERGLSDSGYAVATIVTVLVFFSFYITALFWIILVEYCFVSFRDVEFNISPLLAHITNKRVAVEDSLLAMQYSPARHNGVQVSAETEPDRHSMPSGASPSGLSEKDLTVCDEFERPVPLYAPHSSSAKGSTAYPSTPQGGAPYLSTARESAHPSSSATAKGSSAYPSSVSAKGGAPYHSSGLQHQSSRGGSGLDEIDASFKNFFKINQSVQRERSHITRPKFLDVLRGNHYEKACNLSSPSSDPRSPTSVSPTSSIRRQKSEERILNSTYGTASRQRVRRRRTISAQYSVYKTVSPLTPTSGVKPARSVEGAHAFHTSRTPRESTDYSANVASDLPKEPEKLPEVFYEEEEDGREGGWEEAREKARLQRRRVVVPEGSESVVELGSVDPAKGLHPGWIPTQSENDGDEVDGQVDPRQALPPGMLTLPRDTEKRKPRLGSIAKQPSYEEAVSLEPLAREGAGQEVSVYLSEEEDEYRLSHDKKPFPVNLLLSELYFHDGPEEQEEYNTYSWYLIAMVVFYGIPAFQLVIAYQQLLNLSGNQDICYYNTLCSHPWRVNDYFILSSFNNIFSNIGYVALGLLFMLLTWRRRRVYLTVERLNVEEDNPEERVGVPQHFGIYYAIGLALVAEGFLSAAYHICPSNTNYQFDTTFMFVLAGLGLYKLIECRCPDLVPPVHTILVLFAAVIVLVVVGVLYSYSIAFYVIFFLLHILATFIVTVEVYYRWQIIPWRLKDLKSWYTSVRQSPWPPKQKPKFGMVILANILNFCFALYAVVVRPPDFSSLFLTVMISNFGLALIYYFVTKLIYRERPSYKIFIYLVLAVVLWAVAIYFYTTAVTNWLLSPAQSRSGNQECLVLGFFDHHDLWHFVSAFALFFSFLMLMTLDDHQEATRRRHLRVF